MIPGLTTAAAGMTVNERMQQLLANNLANQDTPGFKVSAPETIEAPQQDMYRSAYGTGLGTFIGRSGSGVTFQEGVPVFTAGSLQQTNRSLDAAIVDTTPTGPYATVQNGNASTSIAGPVTVGNGGQLGINGRPLTVFDANGQAVPGVFAARNPQYLGSALTGVAGAPDYDAAGNPSYRFVNAAGQVVATPGVDAGQGLAIRVGNQSDMGFHSFYAVDYQSSRGPTGIAVTKDGALQLDANNNVVDSSGHRILPIGPNGLPIQGGRITVNPNYQGSSLFGANGQALTDSKGQVSYRVYGAGGNVVPGARLGTVDVDVTQVSPLGQTEFMVGNSLTATSVLPMLRAGSGQIKPGQLEGSNVDATSTMTLMMNAVNSYQANQQVIQAEDNLLNKAANDIGKVNG